MTSAEETAFGALLRRLRIRACMSQEALAQRAGLSADTAAALEAGRRRRPRAFTAGLLADALGLGPDERAQFAAGATTAGTPVPDRPVPDRPPPLPAPLVGREHDLEAVTRMLLRPEVRILTLTSAGGVGKSSLAIAVADTLREHFPDGVIFVALASLRDHELVLPTIAAAVGLQDTIAVELRPRLLTRLDGHRLLLILDNFEHLLPAAATVAELAGACTRRSGYGASISSEYQPWPCRLRCGCSPSEPGWPTPPSRSTRPLSKSSARCAEGWTGCRWPSSSPLPGSACSRLPRCCAGSTANSSSSPTALTTRPIGSARSEPPSTGATSSSAVPSSACSPSWPSSRVAICWMPSSRSAVPIKVMPFSATSRPWLSRACLPSLAPGPGHG